MKQLVALLSGLMSKPGPAKKTKARKAKRSRGARGSGERPGDGTITISRKELVATIELGANKSEAGGEIDLVPASFSFLKGISKSFEQVKWIKLHFFYKPAVGTTYGGLVSMGVDWDYATATTVDRTKVSAFTPNATVSAWTDSESRPLVLPTARLQSRKWYMPNSSSVDKHDKGPGQLHWAASGTSASSKTILGEIWATYTLHMAGTNPA